VVCVAADIREIQQTGGTGSQRFQQVRQGVQRLHAGQVAYVACRIVEM